MGMINITSISDRDINMAEYKEILAIRSFDGKNYKLYSVATNKSDAEETKERLIQAYKISQKSTPLIRIVPIIKNRGYAIYTRGG